MSSINDHYYTQCPTCYGKGVYPYYQGNIPNEEMNRAVCDRCKGNGLLCVDNLSEDQRSMISTRVLPFEEARHTWGMTAEINRLYNQMVVLERAAQFVGEKSRMAACDLCGGMGMSGYASTRKQEAGLQLIGVNSCPKCCGKGLIEVEKIPSGRTFEVVDPISYSCYGMMGWLEKLKQMSEAL